MAADTGAAERGVKVTAEAAGANGVVRVWLRVSTPAPVGDRVCCSIEKKFRSDA